MAVTLAHPSEASWYALYTRSRTEKKVFQELEKNGIEVFLPLRRTLKQWSDRKKWVEEPLLRSYVFVRISEKDYGKVVQTLGIVRFITFSGKAASIPDWQIDSLRLLISSGLDLTISNEHYQPGDPVEIVSGSLSGFKGEILEIKGRKQVFLRISHLGYMLEVNVSPGLIRPIPAADLAHTKSKTNP
jgi:transcriptional antiterminator RfaH